MAMDSQKFCLKWDGFQSSVTSLFDSLRQVEELVDITLCCEGQQIRAHRMMLSACSPYFRDLLKNNPCQQMVFFLKDTSAADLSAVIEFIYKGSVNVAQSQLASFIKTAEMLQIRGLSGDDDKAAPPPPPSPVPRRSAPAAAPPPAAAAAATPPQKRRRLSGSDSAGYSAPSPPTQRLRTPTPPPPPPLPPQQQPGPVLAPLPPLPPAPAPMMELPPEQRPMERPPPQEEVKVEKIDLTEDDDDASLDSTLCHVAEYEGAYDGSNQSLDVPLLAASELGALPPLGPGPSQQQRVPGAAAGAGAAPGDDGATSAVHSCDTCGKTYSTRQSLNYHLKVHTGSTTCMYCGMVASKVAHLRTHLKTRHKLTVEQIRAVVPTRDRERYNANMVTRM